MGDLSNILISKISHSQTCKYCVLPLEAEYLEYKASGGEKKQNTGGEGWRRELSVFGIVETSGPPSRILFQNKENKQAIWVEPWALSRTLPSAAMLPSILVGQAGGCPGSRQGRVRRFCLHAQALPSHLQAHLPFLSALLRCP